MSVSASSNSRIVSLDQFRGYTVVGMMVVNFFGDFHAIHPVLKHHDTYFSYADTIMPSFHFAVGFALRLTLLRRLETPSKSAAYLRVVRRCLGLILLSTVIEFASANRPYEHWSALEQVGFWSLVAKPLKNQFWETLAIIGVTSLWILPVVAGSRRLRLLFLVGSLAAHVVLSHLFYFHFMYARPNWLDSYWGATDTRGLDGGPLGFLAWAFPQLLGSLAYDVVASRRRDGGFVPLMGWALILMGLGYGLSCVSQLYPLTEPPTQKEGDIQMATSPMLPPTTVVTTDNWRSYLAKPPFVQPAKREQRQLSYWLMAKRMVTLPFNLMSSGFALAVYCLFILLSDLGPVRIGLFRTFGQNALAAYILHEMVARAVSYVAPEDSPEPWMMGSFAVFFAITYLFVRTLEKNGVYLRM
jgi:predicted acyltransferase